ncbi:MAG: molybdopterin-dependent oxidoreductase [Candidatus Binatia bacterium]|nr:molybdopterin-dependent oxidoreductase [Candidatus Binatia bacterium]MDG1960313.1 molybdopterin-dependent oxidoreductase [Candidatus Binatia bacterium]MDG2008411.1 molybdopterin-dependent oxidoreductase [Candidatus Binatia bacterium]
MKTHIKTCPLCEAMCGLRVSVENGKVSSIRPNPDDVWSEGYICPKGVALADLHADPDRLRRPLVKKNGQFQEVGWDEAFEAIARGLAPVRERHGMAALSTYIGNPAAHNHSLSRMIAAFMPMSGIPVVYSSGTVDQWPKNVSSALLYGGMWTIPVPDVDRTDHILLLGANPSASQGSLLAAANLPARLDAIRERGGRVVVVDPRRTKTAERADDWVPIQPGTDALLLLAIAHTLFAEKRVRAEALEGQINGLFDVEQLVEDFSPAAVADVCRIPAAKIIELARDLSDARTACVYGRIGTCNQEFGTLASWIIDVLNVLTGNFDKPGGMMFSDPVVPSLTTMPHPDFPGGKFSFGRWKSRVRGAPEVLGQVPVSCLAEEIATPGEGQIRALITIAGNPVVSAPDCGRLDEALPGLDFMVSVDNWVNETTRHADVILPGQSPLEQPHCDDLLLGWAVRNHAKWSDPVFEPPAGQPLEWEILLKLAGIVSGAAPEEADPTILDDLFFTGLIGALTEAEAHPLAGRDVAEIVAATEGRGPDRLVDLAIRTGPQGDHYGRRPTGLTRAKLAAQPNGVDFGPLEPRLGEVLQTPSGRMELAPEYILGDLDRLRQRLGRGDEGLVLVSRRHLRSNNSWLHNVPKLVSGKDRCTLLMHPEDADRCGLSGEQHARIESRAGALEVSLEVSDEMMPGVVSLPHGWGHDLDGVQLQVAAAHAGVNNNLLAPGDLVDVPSGNAVVNGIPVAVSPIRPS